MLPGVQQSTLLAAIRDAQPPSCCPVRSGSAKPQGRQLLLDEPPVTEAVQTTDELGPLRTPEFSEPLEDMIALLSQSKRLFLFGAGCSKCAGLPLMAELTKSVIEAIPDTDIAHKMLTGLIKTMEGNGDCTIEDYMSEIVDLISIAERRQARRCTTDTVAIQDESYSAEQLRESLVRIKSAVRDAINKGDVKIHAHREFVRAVHGRLSQGRELTHAPVDYFTLNYDLLLEDAIGLERVPIADGFNGGATGWWTREAYGNGAARARVFKVHGSIDWCLLDSDILPRRVRPLLEPGPASEPVLIWPASTKYREAQRDPHAQIMAMLRQQLRPASNCEAVLTIAGYSFGDEHINVELDRALRESTGRLTVLVFAYDEEPSGLVRSWLDDPLMREHIRAYTRRGFFHGEKEIRSGSDLPWWRFEILARLLGGDR